MKISTIICILAILAGLQSSTGSISGRVTLRDTGQPVSGLHVRLWQKVYDSEGVLRHRVAKDVVTDAEGNYELAGVPAGKFYIATGEIGELGKRYVRFYYPNTADESAAERIEFSPETRLNSVDFTITQAQPVTLRGRFVDGLGRRLPHIDTISLRARGFRPESSPGRKLSFVNTDVFEVPDVYPGSYYVVGWRFDDEERAETMLPIEVKDSDVEDLEIVSLESYHVRGRVRFDGPALPFRAVPSQSGDQGQLDLSNCYIRVRALDDPELMWPGTTIRPDHTFEIYALPAGTFRLSVTGIPAPYYLKSARFRQTDVLENGITVRPLATGQLEVTLASNGALVGGLVRNSYDQAIGGASVVLVPENRGLLRPDLYKKVITAKDGRFAIEGIAPGNYRIYAWEYLPEGAYFDGGFLSQFDGSAIPLRIVAGTETTVELTAK